MDIRYFMDSAPAGPSGPTMDGSIDYFVDIFQEK